MDLVQDTLMHNLPKLRAMALFKHAVTEVEEYLFDCCTQEAIAKIIDKFKQHTSPGLKVDSRRRSNNTVRQMRTSNPRQRVITCEQFFKNKMHQGLIDYCLFSSVVSNASSKNSVLKEIKAHIYHLIQEKDLHSLEDIYHNLSEDRIRLSNLGIPALNQKMPIHDVMALRIQSNISHNSMPLSLSSFPRLRAATRGPQTQINNPKKKEDMERVMIIEPEPEILNMHNFQFYLSEERPVFRDHFAENSPFSSRRKPYATKSEVKTLNDKKKTGTEKLLAKLASHLQELKSVEISKKQKNRSKTLKGSYKEGGVGGDHSQFNKKQDFEDRVQSIKRNFGIDITELKLNIVEMEVISNDLNNKRARFMIMIFLNFLMEVELEEFDDEHLSLYSNKKKKVSPILVLISQYKKQWSKAEDGELILDESESSEEDSIDIGVNDVSIEECEDTARQSSHEEEFNSMRSKNSNGSRIDTTQVFSLETKLSLLCVSCLF